MPDWVPDEQVRAPTHTHLRGPLFTHVHDPLFTHVPGSTCNDRGYCHTGKEVCQCGNAGFYDGETCEKVAPAFVVGAGLLGINLLFTLNMMVLMLTGGKGAPWWFNKDGSNKALKEEHRALLEETRKLREERRLQDDRGDDSRVGSARNSA